MERGCGIYLPLLKVKSKYGYGSMSKEAYELVDFLSEIGVKYWQIDDLGIIDEHLDKFLNKPKVSAFAIDPLYIDIEKLLVSEEIEFFKIEESENFEQYRERKTEALRYIFDKYYYITNIDKFISDNEYWVYDYAVYMCLKDELGTTYADFPLCYKNLDSKETISFIKTHSEDIIYYIFMQYLLFKQWRELKKYANSKSVKIISKIVENCRYDSSDVYSKPRYFELDTLLKPTKFAVKVDSSFINSFEIEDKKDERVKGEDNENLNYSELVFRRESLKKDRYEWWVERFELLSKIYDYVVINNDNYKSVKAFSTERELESDKANGSDIYTNFNLDNLSWLKNNAIKNIIIKNVGNNLEKEEFLKLKLGYPLKTTLSDKYNMSYKEGEKELKDISSKLDKNSVVYLGDDDKNLSILLKNTEFRKKICCQLNLTDLEDNNENNKIIIKMAIEDLLSSNANVCIIDASDIESLDDKNTNDGENKSYQSEKYFEYLKQLIANKNR